MPKIITHYPAHAFAWASLGALAGALAATLVLLQEFAPEEHPPESIVRAVEVRT